MTVNSQTIDRWRNPPAWPEWRAELALEMERHGHPFGAVDLDTYREYFENGIGPHQAIEEEVNYAE